jgi:hypothetical protein
LGGVNCRFCGCLDKNRLSRKLFKYFFTIHLLLPRFYPRVMTILRGFGKNRPDMFTL